MNDFKFYITTSVTWYCAIGNFVVTGTIQFIFTVKLLVHTTIIHA